METPFKSNRHYKSDDCDLLVNAQAGKRDALNKLIIKHRPFIYNIAWKMFRNPSDAEDLTQEVLIKIVTQLGEFKKEGSFTIRCYRIAINHFINSKRKVDEHLFTSFDEMAKNLKNTPDKTLTIEEQKSHKDLIKEMNYSCISGMLLCLSRDQRIVFILGELFNADHTLASEILGISKENFRIKLARARKELSCFLNNNCGLVNKSNACRCYKKVTHAIKTKLINHKDLHFNRKDYVSFQKVMPANTEGLIDSVEQRHENLFKSLPFKKEFKEKTFLEEILDNRLINSLFNLN